MNNEPSHNPVGTEHPFRGCIVGAAVLALAAAAIVSLCVSCIAMPQDGEASRTFVTNAIHVVGEWTVRVLESGREETAESVSDAPVETAQAESSAVADASGTAERLVYRFGGFDGSHAVETPNARISDLRVTSSGMSYKWVDGGCEALGASSREDYSHTVACAFYWDEATAAWIGGKFDWVSTSRTSRDWVNVRDGYGGWNAEAFFAAKRRAFCIVAANGKLRTNLITDN